MKQILFVLMALVAPQPFLLMLSPQQGNPPGSYNSGASGGGGGNGTVNSGTGNQVAYYAANGTAVSGNANFTTDANGNVTAASVTTTGSGYSKLAGQSDDACSSSTVGEYWRSNVTASSNPRFCDGSLNGSLPLTYLVENCTTDANCASQAATTPGTGNGNFDSASGASGTSTLYFKGLSVPANTIGTNTLLRACAVFQVTSSASPTLLVSFNLGTTAVVQGPALAPVSSTNKGWTQCVTLQGTAAAGASVSVVGGWDGFLNPNNTYQNQIAEPVSGIATNASLIASWSALWSAATAGNSVVLESQYLQRLN